MSNSYASGNRPWIRPLPERVINKIAAGEVIERPAAVVKELVENSIDAGATRIDIVVEKSGARRITIIDNGCGIAEEQVEIAFARHATSKIRNFDDLNNLYSYGFRGEALPSIASVSRLRMVTRPHDAASAVEIIYEGGVLQSKQPIAAPPGTQIEIENLFFNTPARRKFMKAETTEARHISRTAMALAIGRCDIGFSYTLNERSVFSLPAGSNLADRVAGILGADKKYVRVAGETGPVRVEGYIGTPEMVQNNRFSQFMYINNRYIYSPTLSHALVAGYGELIPRGTFPVGALLLTVDAAEVDVNVHPTKAEVRLSREKEVHDAVYHIIKDSLRQDGIIPDFKGMPAPFIGGNQGSADSVDRPGGRSGAYIPGVYNRDFVNHEFLSELYKPSTGSPASLDSDIIRVDKNTGEVIGTSEQPRSEAASDRSRLRLVGRFADLYLLLQGGDDLYIVDQHTAHERVLYEETLARIEKNSVDGQSLLFPVQVELNPEQMAMFDEIVHQLNQAGFAVSFFGGRMVNIEAVPVILGKKSPSETFLKIIDDLASLRRAGQDLNKAMAQSIACRAAVMAGDRLTDEEATHLLSRLLACDNKYSCPHGRPTFVRISREDLDKQFGRA